MEYNIQHEKPQSVLGIWRIGFPRYLPIHHLVFWLAWGFSVWAIQNWWTQYRGEAIIIGIGVFILVQLYRFLDLSSIDVFADQYGVWVKRGFLPWKAGITGVKWRDLEAVTFHRGFYSWITRCYDLKFRERFTEKNPVVVRGIYLGDHASTLINTHLMKLSVSTQQAQ